MNDINIKTPTAARQGSNEGVVRWVLIISTVVVIVALAVMLVVAR